MSAIRTYGPQSLPTRGTPRIVIGTLSGLTETLTTLVPCGDAVSRSVTEGPDHEISFNPQPNAQ